MTSKLFKGETLKMFQNNTDSMKMSDEEINQKYEEGVSRIITEQGGFKLVQIRGIIGSGDYKLRPPYQRRLTWKQPQKSKLIESFVMNVPVPPIFLYEYEFGKYEVMDGLQRLSTIYEFYKDEFELVDLTEWPELNGKTYSTLPEKIKQGIDRRQLSYINLLKESAKEDEKARLMKKLVFERLNSGGMKLEEQEIRNALYNGDFNVLCITLSENKLFRKMWNFPIEKEKIKKHKACSRMTDVELVLRYFAMRHIDKLNNMNDLATFLDNTLRSGNEFSNELRSKLEDRFIGSIELLYNVFGEKAFCKFNSQSKNKKWSIPFKYIYDPMMISIDNYIDKKLKVNFAKENAVKKLKKIYEENEEMFDGKRQGKKEIQQRAELFDNLLIDFFA